MYVVKRSSFDIVVFTVPVAYEPLLDTHFRLLLAAENTPESAPTVLMSCPVLKLGLFVLLPVFPIRLYDSVFIVW